MYRTKSAKSFVNGVNIAYQRVGVGPRPILLLPGALSSGATAFAGQLEGLNHDEFTMIAMDFRGCGQSIPPEADYPIDFFHRDAKDAAQLMENLGFSKFSILGWSDGSCTACIVAGQNPHKVDKLVIWGGAAYVTTEMVAFQESVRDISTWSQRTRESIAQLYQDGEKYVRKAWNARIDTLSILYEKHGGNICMDEVKKISASCLIIHSVNDPAVPMNQPEYLHKNIKNSILDYWHEGRHNLHMPFSQRFNAEVEQFLLIGKIKNKAKGKL